MLAGFLLWRFTAVLQQTAIDGAQAEGEKMCKPPTDSWIYVRELEETILSCFGQWKEITTALYRYLGKDACARVKDLDCIEWFCCAMNARLTELKRQGKYPEVFAGLIR